MITFPKSPGGASQVILDAGVWDDVADMLSRTANLTVAAPLQMIDSAAGKVISLDLSPPIPLVKVTSAASGGGKYNGRIWSTPTTALADTGNVSEADLGVTTTKDILIFNAAEVNVSTHDLTTGTPKQKIFIGVFLGVTSGGVDVYGINGFDIENCL